MILPKKILVIQQKMIGDVLVSSIICENLAVAFPNAQIDYLVHHHTVDVLDHQSESYNIIAVSEKERKSKVAFLKKAWQLRKNQYDLIIDCYSKLESWLIVALSNAKTKVSFDKKAVNFLYTHTTHRNSIPKTNLGLTIEDRLQLLPLIGVQPTITRPQLKVLPEEKQWAKDILSQHQIPSSEKLLMISAIGSQKEKTYPLPYLAELLDTVVAQANHITLLLNYMPSQKQQIEELLSFCQPETRKKIKENIVGENLRQLIALTEQCEAIVGNDGGAINIAKALNKPSFTIFSPTIKKAGWNSFEDGVRHISFELADFRKEDFRKKLSSKEIKNQIESLYLEFKPDFLKPHLKQFITTHFL